MSNRREFARAEPYFRDALAIYQAVMGTDHFSTAVVETNLGWALYQQGKQDEAIRSYRSGLATLRDKAVNPILVATPLVDFATLLLERGEAGDAEDLSREALVRLADALPERHWRILGAEAILGSSLTAQGRFEEAEPLLLKGYNFRLEDRGADNSFTRQALERLIQLYDRWERPSEADRYRRLGDRVSR